MFQSGTLEGLLKVPDYKERRFSLEVLGTLSKFPLEEGACAVTEADPLCSLHVVSILYIRYLLHREMKYIIPTNAKMKHIIPTNARNV